MKLDDCRWQDALDWQMRSHRWLQTERGERYMRSFPLSQVLREQEPSLAARMVDGLAAADPWWVQRDAVSLVEHASIDMPHDPLLEEDIPAPTGFALLQGPPLLHPAISYGKFPEDGTEPKKSSLRALSWFTGYLQLDDGDGRGLSEPLLTVYATTWAHIEDDDDFVDDVRKLRDEGHGLDADLAPTAALVLPVGRAAAWWSEERPEMNTVLAANRWILAFFRFVQQEVVYTERQRWPRAGRREASRALSRDDGDVSLVHLRRVLRLDEHGERPESEPSGRHLTHRHIRSGHWRRQWYPSAQVHRPIYIHPFVVGPEGAPLLPRKTRSILVDR